MAQLVELNKNAAKFKETGVEVIAVFREEEKGKQGLKQIKDKTGVDFTLCLDTGKKKTPRYSPGKMEFTNYVIGSDGNVKAIIQGDLRDRAKSEELLTELARLNEDD